METILLDKDFSYVGTNERAFLVAFDKKMCDLGYARMGIGDFARWGNYTVAYLKPNAKSRNYISKIMFDGKTVSFRFYLKNIDQHAAYIENAPAFIKETFINDGGKCSHCKTGGSVKPDDTCPHRKVYTIDGITYHKCDGLVFYYHDLDIEKLSDYISLLTQFYPVKNRRAEKE